MKDNKSSKEQLSDDRAKALTQQVVNELDRQNSELPESTSARLQAIRLQALREGQHEGNNAPVQDARGFKAMLKGFAELFNARPISAFASISGIAVAAYFVVVQVNSSSVENGQPFLANNQTQQHERLNGQEATQESLLGVALLEQELSEDPEMLADLEFAAWLAEQPEVQDT